MKKVVLDLAVTLDGFIEGPNGEIDWCIMDEEMNFDGFLEGIDTIFYGRVSYDMWGNYEPEETTSEAELSLWKTVHSKNKFVFSSQPRQDSRATFIHAGIAEQVRKIKTQGGKDIWLYGGSSLVKTFIELGLIDQYRISIHPVVLGSGKPLFDNLQERLNFRLTDTKVFKSGVVQVVYEAGSAFDARNAF
jgi:dihydrofolate reductase